MFSLFYQFVFGGIFVSGISYLSNALTDTVLAGVIASIPLGMPTTLVVKNQNIKGYTTNLLVMTSVLFFVTFTNWFFINKLNYNKYEGVKLSMFLWFIIGLLYWYMNKK